MLLSYLNENFMEELAFTDHLHITVESIRNLTENRLFPAPSYVLEQKIRTQSFIGDFHEKTTVRYHLKGHVDWFKTIDTLGLDSEERAQTHFAKRYSLSKDTFFSGIFGQQLNAVAPDVRNKFNNDHADMTWNYFLDGVYGVCTRDGLPETIFLKQVSVMYIEAITQSEPQFIGSKSLDLLFRTVNFLDKLESDFAPHEVVQTSRQRCIINVREQYFNA